MAAIEKVACCCMVHARAVDICYSAKTCVERENPNCSVKGARRSDRPTAIADGTWHSVCALTARNTPCYRFKLRPSSSRSLACKLQQLCGCMSHDSCAHSQSASSPLKTRHSLPCTVIEKGLSDELALKASCHRGEAEQVLKINEFGPCSMAMHGVLINASNASSMREARSASRSRAVHSVAAWSCCVVALTVL